MQAARAEVVWKDEAADLALLRADLGVVPVFPWAPEVAEDDTVLVGGRRSPSAGRVLAVNPGHTTEEGAEIPSWFVRHDAPVQDGDSGGAVGDELGRLIGVHTSTGFTVIPPRKVRRALRPDVARLTRFIGLQAQ